MNKCNCEGHRGDSHFCPLHGEVIHPDHAVKSEQSPHPEHAEGSSLGERDCDKCLRLCPQKWEILKTGSTKEEWGRKQAEWWDGRSKHMGCGRCNIEQMYTHPMTGEGEGR